MTQQFLTRRKFAGGNSLASTLMLTAVLLTLAFALAGVGVSNLSFTNRLDTLERGRALSESVIALASDSLRTNADFGTAANRGGLLEMLPRSGPGRALLTFDPALASQLKIPCSVNNLTGTAAVPGWGRPVPPASAHLVGCSTVGGVTRNVEVILQVPPFPYAISSGRSLKSSGNLLVGALPPGADVMTADLSEDGLQPANLLSNGSGPGSLALGPNSIITGDVRSAGEVSIDPLGSRIGGQVKHHSDPIDLPRLDLSDYDPVRQGRSNVRELTDSRLSNPALVGFVRRQGDLDVRDGLVLDNGVLYVDGNLDIKGGVHGVGAIFVTGDTTVKGGSNLASDNQVALLTGGAVKILGGGPKDSTFFQGMMYSEGDFHANSITIVGALVAQGDVKLTGSTLVLQPEAAKLEMSPSAMSELTLTDGIEIYRIPVRYDAPTFTVQNPITLVVQSGLTRDQAVDQVDLVLDQIAPSNKVQPADIQAAVDSLRSSPPSPSQDRVSVDLSKFMPLEQRIRIVLWRQKEE